MSPRRIWMLGAAALVYAAAAIGLQAGVRTLGLATLVAIGVGLVVGLVFGFIRTRLSAILFAALLPLVLWIWGFGSYSFTRDMIGGAVGLALAWPLARALSGWRKVLGVDDRELERPRRRFIRRFLLISLIFIWIINSALNVVFESTTYPRPETPLSAARSDQGPWPGARVGVALSGGGYRATLMHAGVLAELDAMRVPVTAISTVSGGSIAGSFYAAGGSPHDIRAAVAGGRFNLKRDMADIHNALRMPFPFEVPYADAQLFPWLAFGRVDVQANLVDRVLLGGVTVGELQHPGRPLLQICTSDLKSGSAVGLSSDGVLIQSPARPARSRSGGELPYEVTRSFHPGLDPETRVAKLVAASGAFPGAFSGVELQLGERDGYPARGLLLADGGIVDNWGVGLLLGRAAQPGDHPWRIDLLLISAGGRIFKEDDEVPAPEEVRRAIDIVYETAGWRPVELTGEPEPPPILLVQPADAGRESTGFRAFADAGTLEDQFSAAEAELLFNLGRELVRNGSAELERLLTRPAAAN